MCKDDKKLILEPGVISKSLVRKLIMGIGISATLLFVASKYLLHGPLEIKSKDRFSVAKIFTTENRNK